MENHYNIETAEMAQKDYTTRNQYPFFAPKGGICYHCGRNIYIPVKNSIGMVYGYSVEYADNHLITYCPFCNVTFTD